MNIYQNVIDSVAATGGDITESGGFINIAGSSPLSIPKGRIMGAKRVLAGERAQWFTITTPATVSNATTYSVTVSGKSPVTGILKSFYSTYTTPAATITRAELAAALAAGFAISPDFPFTVDYTTGGVSFILKAKSGTPVIGVAVSPSVGSGALTFANTTTALTTVANISTAGVITVGSGTPFTSAAVDLGKMVTINDGTTFYTGIVKTFTSSSQVTATPNPSAEMIGGNDSLFVIENTGAALESVYAYAGLPGVTLAPATRYVIYEIDAVAPSYAGNGARPDAIDSKYIIYVNAGVAATWASDGFDATLATRTGFAF